MTCTEAPYDTVDPVGGADLEPDSGSAEEHGPSRTRRRVFIALAVVLAVGLVALWPRSYDPLDPDSPRPDGALAVTRLVEEYGADVAVSDRIPTVDDDVAVLLVDDLSSAAARGLRAWVSDDGGTLIVPSPGTFGGSFGDLGPDNDDPERSEIIERARGECTMSALDQIAVISVYDPEPTAEAQEYCFDAGDGPLVTTSRFGEGNIVVVADMAAFSNELLGLTDNAALAVTLMAPSTDASVVFLRPEVIVPTTTASTSSGSSEFDLPDAPERERVGTGNSSLADLLPPYFFWVFVQLLVAWLLFVLARARRFGRPVHEPLPVRVPGSALVEATGRLLRRTNQGVTAQVLVDSFREDLRIGLIQSADIDDADLVKVAADQSGVDPVALTSALTVPIVDTDVQLVSLSNRLDSLRQEVLRDRSPTAQ